eukprot:scpid83476/ scgid18504/ 
MCQKHHKRLVDGRLRRKKAPPAAVTQLVEQTQEEGRVISVPATEVQHAARRQAGTVSRFLPYINGSHLGAQYVPKSGSKAAASSEKTGVRPPAKPPPPQRSAVRRAAPRAMALPDCPVPSDFFVAADSPATKHCANV